MSTVIKVENLSKQYRLGQVGTGSMAHDINRFWHQLRGKEDPYLKIGEENDRSVKGNSEYVWALKNINFDVKHGEVLGIIGRNGAGKSTLLKILSRTTTPTAGSVKIKGRVASLLEVGTGFHPELSGRENIFLNGAILGMTKQEIKSKFDEIVDFSGVERYIDTPVKRYSSGMYVRLAFGVAAHLEPEILIVDEVLAVGDAEFQKKAIGRMQLISKKEGRTVLVVSHNLQTIEKLCTKGILFEKGSIISSGTPRDITALYNREPSVPDTLNEISTYDLTINPTKEYTAGMIGVDTFCDGEPGNILYPGSNFTFVTTIEDKKLLNDIVFGFQINNEEGTPVVGIHNKIYGQKISVIPFKSGKIKVEIPSLPIIQKGVYTVDLFLGEGMTNYDVVKSAFHFYLNPDLNKAIFYPITQTVNQVFIDKIQFQLL